MERVKEDLWKVLRELRQKEFRAFKWLLKLNGIPESQLENAEVEDVVDLVTNKHGESQSLRVVLDILVKIPRLDLVQALESAGSGLTDVKKDSGGQKEEENQKEEKVDLKSVQKYAVEVTLDEDTAHPHLVLSSDRKQVHHGDKRRKLPDNPKRFDTCVNVLGKEGFSCGRSYFEVGVKGKTAWAVGVAKESINRKGDIAAKPKKGYWTIMLRKGDTYEANGNSRVTLAVNQPQKVGVFVDYEEGLVSFYDADSAAHLHSFADCDFTETLYPFFTPFKNEDGRNSAPLVLTPVNQTRALRKRPSESAKEKEEKKRAELKSVQQFAAEVTLDPDTAHPALVLSDDGKQVYCTEVYKNLPKTAKRFTSCVNVLGRQHFSSGKFYFEIQVKKKTAWTVGVAKESIERQGSVTLNPGNGFWTIWLRNGDEYEAIDQPSVRLSEVKSKIQKVGVFVDYEGALVSFYNVDTADLLYSFTDCSFSEKLFPYISPCTSDGGQNSAPIVISSLHHILQKKAKLTKIQQFAVEVVLDPDTAHPALVLSADGKQVYDGDVRQKLPYNPKRFRRCVNVLGKQSFSSGKSYFEVQVKGKSAWTVGVAKESIERKGDITLSPGSGFWTIWLRNGKDYKANEDPSVSLSLKSPLQKVGVFVDYEAALVSFYDVESADLLYSFTDCTFTESVYPYFSPCTCDGGKNAAPLVLASLDHILSPDSGALKEEYDRRKAELKRVQQHEVEVSLDPDTAHPALTLSEDLKQVCSTDVYKKLDDNPKRFDTCVDVLGRQAFSSGQFYFEVQVRGKTAWTLGLASASVRRKGTITISPEDGFWAIRLKNKTDYKAIDDPSCSLKVKSHLQKVGVFGDYDKGTISFYDVDSADLLYSFTECSFIEELHPFFSPSTIDNGINAAPLVICPINPKEDEDKKEELKRIQQFAVEVTLDPDTANPFLALSDDGKQVYDTDVKKKLPNNPKRFSQSGGVLGKEAFSSGKHYYVVQVKGKTAWSLGLASESVSRKGGITLSPEDGYWTIWLREQAYTANDDSPVQLLPSQPLHRVGVLVDHGGGMVSFYNADTGELLYSYTECSFSEKLYPFFSPADNNEGENSTPLIICPANLPPGTRTPASGSQEDDETKKAELRSVQQFAVDVTLDPDTANPYLVLSDDGKEVHDSDVRKKLPSNPKRFDKCVDVLGQQSFSTGKYYFEVQVKGKTAWSLGVASESVNRKGKITLSPEDGFWTIWLRNGDEYTANDDRPVRLSLRRPPRTVGIFVDYESGVVSFYDAVSGDALYSYTQCCFSEKLYPFFSPSANDHGKNSAPLVITPVDHPLTKDEERRKAELERVRRFAVAVTLDPDTANPYLVLSDGDKQVHHGDARQELPNNPKRFDECFNVLARQGVAAGKFYYEVQVQGKTDWTVGVASESSERKGNITLSPEDGFWTIWLRNEDEYEAIDYPSVHLTVKSHLQKVGVFVDYEGGVVSFYDADSADLLYSFTNCSFSDRLLPFFNPCTNEGGRNAAPLVLSPVNPKAAAAAAAPDARQQREARERDRAALRRAQQSAVDVTLDPDSAHPHLVLSEDLKQVHHGDVRQKLPFNPKRFRRCVNVLGRQSFSSGKFYFEIDVRGKTAWTVGVAKESIERKGDVSLCPDNGFWTIWLRNGDEYEAIDDPSVSLAVGSRLDTVGVFADYEGGVVSFYNVDTAERLYTFAENRFTENLLPYFSPCTNDDGRNSAPLVIRSVPAPPPAEPGDFCRSS